MGLHINNKTGEKLINQLNWAENPEPVLDEYINNTLTVTTFARDILGIFGVGNFLVTCPSSGGLRYAREEGHDKIRRNNCEVLLEYLEENKTNLNNPDKVCNILKDKLQKTYSH